MELLVKCAALAVFSAVSVLLIRRVNPEFALLTSAAAAVVILLSCTALLRELTDSMKTIERIFGSSLIQVRPILKCLAISAISKLSADLCRDASQAALAAAVETAGSLCAAAVAMPMLLTLMTTIGGML